ncbi:hypothetical protein [Mangrovimonas xylaniphaga]|uniref:hypothetical protein n=1 Tax=Mangrovimonas xylaniphaga TaxID=1645915 RepID=UPI0006B60394|nr:hypothetical protein [Mangrovimonas xylaniphaga]
MKNFKIKILDQYWIDKNPNNKTDLCSHGLIQLEIGETIIIDELDNDWTLNTAGLMLLRTINNSHDTNSSFPIIQHCGQLAMLGCPISVDWQVSHKNGNVVISDPRKLLTTDSKDLINYSIGQVNVERKTYIREIVRFCDEIKRFFKDKNRDFTDEYYKSEWSGFWQEFDDLLEKHRIELKNKSTL